MRPPAPLRIVALHVAVVFGLVWSGTPGLLPAGPARPARAVAANLNRLPSLTNHEPLDPPDPSGAPSIAVPNAMIDSYVEGHATAGTPPSNFSFEDPGSKVGTSPPNHEIGDPSTDIGEQAQNNSFESGLSGWTVTTPCGSQVTTPGGGVDGNFAQIAATGCGTPTLVSSAFVVNDGAQVFAWDEKCVAPSGGGSCSYSVRVLVGPSFSGSGTLLHTGNGLAGVTEWREVLRAVESPPNNWRGQTIKLRIQGTGGTVGVDRVRVRALVPEHTTVGIVRRAEGGGRPTPNCSSRRRRRRSR